MLSVHTLGAAQLIAWGVTFYAIPPLLPHIGSSVGLSVSMLTLALTVGLVLNAFASLAIAQWIHRHGARAPMVAGTLVATAALLVLASGTVGAVAFAAIAVLGVAHAALLYEPVFAAVAAHTRDPRARTRAIQVITFWGGWAALWALPVTSTLAGVMGWRWTLVALAALLVVCTLRAHASLPRPVIVRAPARRAASISRGLAAAFALGAFATTAMVVNGLVLLGDRAVSLSTGAIVLASLAPFQILGRVWYMRRAGLAPRDAVIPFLLVGAGLLCLLGAPHALALGAFAALFGAGAGLLTTVRPFLVVAQVAPEQAAIQLGAYSFASSLARAVAPAASSGMYVALGAQLSLVVLAVLAFVAAALIARFLASV